MSRLEREVSKERLSRSILVVISDHGMEGVGGIPSSLQTYSEVWTSQLGELNFFSPQRSSNFVFEARAAAETITQINPDTILLIHPTRYGLATFYMLPDEVKSRVVAYWRTRTDQAHERKFDSVVGEMKHKLRAPVRSLITSLRGSMAQYGVRHIANSRSVAHSLVLAGISQDGDSIAIHRPPLHPRLERPYLDFEQRGSSFNILVVSRVSSEKGLEKIQWLSNQIIKSDISNWNIRVVGPIVDSRYFEVLQKESIGLPIEFLGAKRWPELADFYASSHLLFMPSKTESWGQVTVEAIREGTPVLCLPSSGSEEIFEETNGSIGMLTEMGQESNVVRYLNLVREPKNWGLLSNNCIRESEKYKAEILCQKLLEDVVLGGSLFNG